MITPAALLAVIKFNLLRRPLMHALVAEECLDVNRAQLNALVENGELPWAFDFGASPRRQELRILSACVVERCTGPIPAIGATRNLRLPEVLNLILPATRQSLRGIELQRLFHAHANSIHDLDVAGEIKKVSEKLPVTGPNASPRYTRASVASLLEKRRVT